MTAPLWLLLGLILGALSVWQLQRAEILTLRKEKREAEDRLYYAWRDDKVIPAPRAAEPMKAPEKLPSELQGEIDQWESPESRAGVEAKIRELYFGRGLGVMAVLKAMEDEHPN